ncbi:right-handed parallel beta-helix repeat-containing protein [Treponema sp. OMZ 838]|uniref:right-handed parallel beta-helix repeat-containing protein n=1 Tax=Treponema sp. OMZ 838 TaxID=1539298 RepID=UPI00068BA713|nr:right-handed parallel beta-helix repeat-containing protein [Treponema sp. OMZ 838]
MRKAFIILTGILFTLLFATCQQFTADIDDYLSLWSSQAFILNSTIDKKTYNDANGIVSVASADDVTITLKVQNPKSFRFVMPSASETRNIVGFAHFAGTKPAAGTDYELTQLTADTLQLVYKNSFLKNSEWGEKDISSTITLYANDGRPPFKQTFTIPLKANTPPPKPGYAVAKTAGTSAYYVLCIRVPEMDTAVPGGLLHKDLTRIEVNGTPYTFSVNEAEHTFVRPEADVFITQSAVERLSGAEGDELPTGKWVLYYKTDVEVKAGAAKKDYTIKLIDKKGLVSDILNASTKPNKAEPENIAITKGTPSGGSGSDTNPTIIGTDSSRAELTISSPTANTTVHCTCTDTSDGSVTRYNAKHVTVLLPLSSAGEKKYKLEYYIDGEGFAATPVKTIYYKVAKKYTVTFSAVDGTGGTLKAKPEGGSESTIGSVSVLHGGTVTFTATPTDPTHYKVGDWTCTPSEGFTGASGQSSATLTVTTDTTVSVQFVQLNALNLSKLKIHGRDASVGSVTLPYTITQVKKEDISLAFSGQTGIDFTVTPSLPLNLTEGESLTITINVAADPGNYPAWSKTVSITRVKNDVAKLRSFTLNGETKTAASDSSFASEYEVASEQAEVKGFSFDTGSDGATASVSPAGSESIPVSTGKKFTITVTAQNGTQSTVKFTVKRKKYDVSYSVDNGVGGTLKATPAGGTESTTSSSATVSVEHGGSVTFKAQPNLAWEIEGWTLDSTAISGADSTYSLSNIKSDKAVKVKFKKVTTVKHTDNNAWQLLKEVVKIADNNAVIIIDGEIKATNGDNAGEIKINKHLTIKMADGASSAVIDANKDTGSKPKHRIFKVESGKTLTLENLTLKGGKAEGTQDADNYGGAIYASGAIVNITNCTLKGNEAALGGGAIYAREVGSTASTIKISGGTIGGDTDEDKNKVTSKWQFGGGILVVTGCTLTLDSVRIIGNEAWRAGGVRANESTVKMTDCTIKNNKTTGDNDSGGGGVYTFMGMLIMTGCTITGNEAATNGGGLNVEGTTTNITNCTFTGNTAKNGGGIYTKKEKGTPPTVTINGGTIGGTDTDKANKATGTGSDGNGGGIYIGEDCKVTLQNNGSTGCTITGNTAQRGGGVYVEGGTFKMSGSAVVTPATGSEANDKGKNDVYLVTGQAITVDDPLTPQGGIAARITVPNDNYQTGTKVLAGDKVGTEYTKFVVTPNGNKRWTVKSDGTLSNTLADIFANITKDQIEAEIGAANSAMVYTEGKTITNLITTLQGKLILYMTGKYDYGIMHVTEVNNTSNGGKGHIKFNYKTFRTYHSDVLQNSGKVVNGDASFDLDSGGSGSSGNDFQLKTAASQFKILDNAKFYILPN